jgi:hypothetical protein
MRPIAGALQRYVAASIVIVLACAASARIARAAADDPVHAGAESGAFLSCGVAKGYEEFWFRADAILWQLDGTDLPPLVTASHASVPLSMAGRLDNPSTDILAGGEEVGDRIRAGFALSGGYWIDPYQGWGLAAEYFNAGRDSYGFTGGPNDGRILARPFFDAQAGEQSAEFVEIPTELAGLVRVTAFDNFQGAGGALEARVWCCGDACSARQADVSIVGGYRYYQHDSRLLITESLVVLPDTMTAMIPGTQILVRDRFAARNQFNGAEIGLKGRVRNDIWWIDGSALLAIGGNRRVVFVDGSTFNLVPGVGTNLSIGGLLTSGVTNMGRYADTDGVVIPRFRFGGGVKLTEWLSAKVGYNIIIWDDVAQAGSHLPPGLAVDPRNIPPVEAGGGPEPAFPGIRGQYFVAHGLDLGVEILF